MGNKSSSSSSAQQEEELQFPLTNAPETSPTHFVPRGFYRVDASSSLSANFEKLPVELRKVRVLFFAMCSSRDNRASGDIQCMVHNLFARPEQVHPVLLNPSVRDQGADFPDQWYLYHYRLHDGDNATTATCEVTTIASHAWRWLRGCAYEQNIIGNQLRDYNTKKPLKTPVVLLFAYPDSRDCNPSSDFSPDAYPWQTFVQYVRDDVDLVREWIPSVFVRIEGHNKYFREAGEPFDMRSWCTDRQLPYFVVDLADREELQRTKKPLEDFLLATAYGWYQQHTRGIKQSDLQHRDTLVELSMWVVSKHPELYPQDRLVRLLPEDLREMYYKRYCSSTRQHLEKQSSLSSRKKKKKKKKKSRK